MKKSNLFLSLSLSVGSLVVGLLIAEWFEILLDPLFADQTKAILTSILLVGITALVSLASVIFFSHRAEIREEHWLSIENRLGTPAEIDFEPVAYSEGKFYGRIADLVRQCVSGDEVIVVGNYGPRYGEENPLETENYKLARELYAQTLLGKVRNSEVIYRRIVCFDTPDENKIRVGEVKQWLVDHCQGMLELKRQKRSAISLKKGRTVFGSDILVVKDKVAVISLDVRDSETGHLQTHGAITFYNPPNGNIVRQLYELCMMADNESIPVDRVPEE